MDDLVDLLLSDGPGFRVIPPELLVSNDWSAVVDVFRLQFWSGSVCTVSGLVQPSQRHPRDRRKVAPHQASVIFWAEAPHAEFA